MNTGLIGSCVVWRFGGGVEGIGNRRSREYLNSGVTCLTSTSFSPTIIQAFLRDTMRIISVDNTDDLTAEDLIGVA